MLTSRADRERRREPVWEPVWECDRERPVLGMHRAPRWLLTLPLTRLPFPVLWALAGLRGRAWGRMRRHNPPNPRYPWHSRRDDGWSTTVCSIHTYAESRAMYAHGWVPWCRIAHPDGVVSSWFLCGRIEDEDADWGVPWHETEPGPGPGPGPGSGPDTGPEREGEKD